MNDATYNGWSNKETWYIHAVYLELFESLAEGQKFDNVEDMARAFELLVNTSTFVDKLEFENLQGRVLTRQTVSTYLRAVNWTEIASYFFKGKTKTTHTSYRMKTETTPKVQYKKQIRNALAKVGKQFGREYYNDECNNSLTHRRFKFHLKDLKALTNSELSTFVNTLQESFPQYKVDAKNDGPYVVAYLRWA